MKLLNFRGNNDPATTAKHLNVLPTPFAQQVKRVFEILDMSTLIGGNRNALHIFLYGGIDYFVDRAVMAQMNDFHAAGLQNATHDIDGSVVTVEQAGRGDEADSVRSAALVISRLLA